ncbi:Ribonuclease inhibitor (Ribonuclease/angiogenin inhibitor 1), partial [Durusdinium trenchii]
MEGEEAGRGDGHDGTVCLARGISEQASPSAAPREQAEGGRRPVAEDELREVRLQKTLEQQQQQQRGPLRRWCGCLGQTRSHKGPETRIGKRQVVGVWDSGQDRKRRHEVQRKLDRILWAKRTGLTLVVTGLVILLIARSMAPATTSLACAEGFWCLSQSIRFPCPAGTFGASDDLISDECSGNCEAGYYCPEGSTSAQQEPCPVGHYCPAASPSPLECPNGTFAASLAMKNATCEGLCKAGYYCGLASSSARSAICPKGMFCPTGTRFADEFPCPVGFYNDQEGKESVDDCLVCPAPAGLACQQGSSQSAGAMLVDCPVGHFCPENQPPQPCPSGTFASQTGFADSSCEAFCPDGSWCPAGSSNARQSLCPAGFYCPRGTANYTDYPCWEGYVCVPGTEAPYLLCPRGEYCPTGSAEGIPCPAGVYGGQEGLFTPTCSAPCPAGYYCEAGTVNPFAFMCPAGSYCPEGTTSPEQFLCPERGFSSRIQITSLQECFCDVSTDPLCEENGGCLEGYYCPAGSSSEREIKCPANHYCPANASQPLVCQDPGYYCLERAVAANDVKNSARLTLLATVDEKARLWSLDYPTVSERYLFDGFTLVQGFLTETSKETYDGSFYTFIYFGAARGIATISVNVTTFGFYNATVSVCNADSVAIYNLGLLERMPATSSSDWYQSAFVFDWAVPRDAPLGDFTFCMSLPSGESNKTMMHSDVFGIVRSEHLRTLRERTALGGGLLFAGMAFHLLRPALRTATKTRGLEIPELIRTSSAHLVALIEYLGFIIEPAQLLLLTLLHPATKNASTPLEVLMMFVVRVTAAALPQLLGFVLAGMIAGGLLISVGSLHYFPAKLFQRCKIKALTGTIRETFLQVLCTEVLFVPILQTSLAPFDCVFNDVERMDAYLELGDQVRMRTWGVVQCWNNPFHILLAGGSVITTFGFVRWSLAVRLGRNANPNVRFKKAQFFEVWDIVLRSLLCFAATFADSSPWTQESHLYLTFAMLLFLYSARQYSKWDPYLGYAFVQNTWWTTVYATLTWITFACMVMVAVNKDISQANRTPMPLLHVSWTSGLVLLFMLRKTKHKRTQRARQLRFVALAGPEASEVSRRQALEAALDFILAAQRKTSSRNLPVYVQEILELLGALAQTNPLAKTAVVHLLQSNADPAVQNLFIKRQFLKYAQTEERSRMDSSDESVSSALTVSDVHLADDAQPQPAEARRKVFPENYKKGKAASAGSKRPTLLQRFERPTTEELRGLPKYRFLALALEPLMVMDFNNCGFDDHTVQPLCFMLPEMLPNLHTLSLSHNRGITARGLDHVLLAAAQSGSLMHLLCDLSHVDASPLIKVATQIFATRFELFQGHRTSSPPLTRLALGVQLELRVLLAPVDPKRSDLKGHDMSAEQEHALLRDGRPVERVHLALLSPDMVLPGGNGDIGAALKDSHVSFASLKMARWKPVVRAAFTETIKMEPLTHNEEDWSLLEGLVHTLPSLQRLDFEGCKITEESAQALGNAVAKSASLKCVKLPGGAEMDISHLKSSSKINLVDEFALDDIAMLICGPSIAQNQTVRRLALVSRGHGAKLTGTGVEILCGMLCDKQMQLDKFSLGNWHRGNEVTEAAMISLCAFLDQSEHLRSLDMRHCQISAESATMLCSMLVRSTSAGTTLTSLKLSNNPISRFGAESFGAFLGRNHVLCKLHLAFCGLDEDSVLHLCEALASNPAKLHTLVLDGNRIGTALAMTAIATVLTEPECALRSLSLADCGLRGVSALLVALATPGQPITSLNISSNPNISLTTFKLQVETLHAQMCGLDDRLCADLCETLLTAEQHPELAPLRAIDLSGNRFSDALSIPLARVLASASVNLQCIVLVDNELTQEGKDLLHGKTPMAVARELTLRALVDGEVSVMVQILDSASGSELLEAVVEACEVRLSSDSAVLLPDGSELEEEESLADQGLGGGVTNPEGPAYASAFGPAKPVVASQTFVVRVQLSPGDPDKAPQQPDATVRAGVSGPLWLQEGNDVRLTLVLPSDGSFSCDEPTTSFKWHKVLTSESFSVRCEDPGAVGSHMFQCRIESGKLKSKLLFEILTQTATHAAPRVARAKVVPSAVGALVAKQEPRASPDALVQDFVAAEDNVFISYRRSQIDLADRVRLYLERLGYTVFLDLSPEQGLGAGDFRDQLDAALAKATVVMPLLTPDYLGPLKDNVAANRPDWCFEEIKTALKAGTTVVPLYKGINIGAELADLPSEVAALARVNAFPLFDEVFDLCVQQVHRKIQQHQSNLATRKAVLQSEDDDDDTAALDQRP